jgi:hypothetical protein
VAASTATLADDILFAHVLDERLQIVAQANWTVAGVLAGRVHVLPSGEIVAIVEPADEGKPRLVRWSARGNEVAARDVDVERGIRTTRLQADGMLVLVTNASVAKLGTDGAVVARQRLPFQVGNAIVAPSPRGAWFGFPDRIVYVGLDGARVEKRAPLGVPASPRNGLTGMLATENDDCLIAEENVLEHQVRGRDRGPDLTMQRVLTLVDVRGNVLAKTTLGKTRTRWEWFWREDNQNSSVPIPKDAGIVRARYEGRIAVDGWSERQDGDFLMVLWEELNPEAPRRILLRLDHSLRQRWRKPFDRDSGMDISPGWVRGLLVHGGPGRVISYDEAGRSERFAFVAYPSEADLSGLRGVALGRDTAGRWVVVEYGAYRLPY